MKLNNKFALAAKYVFFNLSLIAMYFTVSLFITLKLYWWMILSAQVMFVIYDYAFTMFINYYMNTIRPKIKK